MRKDEKRAILEYFNGNFRPFFSHYITNLPKEDKRPVLCPFHDDHNPSLSLDYKTGKFYCHACGAEGIILNFYALEHHLDVKRDFSKVLKGIISDFNIPCSNSKKIVKTYDYTDEKGNLLFQVVRYEPKGFAQRRPDGKGGSIWNLNGIKRVLYRLQELIKGSDPVFVVEGEKDADRLIKLGLTATTNPGGSGKWRQEYGEFLRNRDVVIVPDNDPPGKEHGQKVANSLAGKAKRVKVLDLPGLPEKGDVSDWLDKGGNKETLLRLVEEAAEWQPSKKIEIVDDSKFEPITKAIDLDYDIFPSFLRGLLAMISPTTLAPDEFIVTALLTSLSSAIGTRAYIQLGRRVYYPCIWAMLIAGSSDYFKSTAIREGRSFILKRDKEYESIYRQAWQDYQRELKSYKRSSREQDAEATEPTPPIRREIDFSDDETLESFYQTLHDNPDGGLLAFDEIGYWIESFDKYRSGRGEKRRWLTIYDCHPIKYKRKADKTHLVIDKPFVSIAGGITANTFNTLFRGGTSDIENGFLPRFIFCKTPRLTKKDDSFFRPDIDSTKWEQADEIFKRVTGLRPGAVAPSQKGLEMLNEWYRQHQAQKKDPFYPEELSPFWRRLEGYLLKFALIIHQFKRAAGEESNNIISVQTLGEAMALTEYYKGQARPIVRGLCQGKVARFFDDLMALLKKLGGSATIREIQQGKAYWRGRGDDLKEVLGKMEAEGLVELEEYTSGGRTALRAALTQRNGNSGNNPT